ncbi:MAG: glycosyltransferase family A protein [Sideroxyarcus sp.]|nr:glycosyltransferase family A protein [Sideroxyarcus sp.]
MTTVPSLQPAIAIIIPYFQRDQGILRRALDSIARQDTVVAAHVIVVDDASPVPAEDEIASVLFPDHFTCQVIKRANGGPAAARNTGLGNVPKSCQYVAFLDSDDEWSTDHLKNAWTALEAGFDFYFSDLYQLEQSTGAFERAGRITPHEHPKINAESQLHAYQGNMASQILTGNIIGTPTVVFRREVAPEQRFREEFRNAGEDYLFWLEFCLKTDHIAFSTVCEAKCGRGVNVFSGVAWGSLEHMLRTRNMLRYKRFALENMTLTPEVKQHVRSDIRRLREEYCQDLLHVFRHTKQLPWTELIAHLKFDPATLLALPPTIISMLRPRVSK